MVLFKICLDLTAGKLPKPSIPEVILRNLLQSSSQQDRNVEFLKFRKNCPKLLPSVQRELDQLVRSELQFNNVDVNQEQFNRMGSEPLLPALGNKLGLNIDRIIAPPVVECLLCNRSLTQNNPPVQVSLLGIDGPALASKYSWRCRDCHGGKGFIPNNSFFPLIFRSVFLRKRTIFISGLPGLQRLPHLPRFPRLPRLPCLPHLPCLPRLPFFSLLTTFTMFTKILKSLYSAFILFTSFTTFTTFTLFTMLTKL